MAMQPTDLTEHPEGGRFREVFRSEVTVRKAGKAKAALTHIYFSLDPGEVSRFHRVSSDEVWNLYRGQGVRLHVWDGGDHPPETVVLSVETNTFCHVIPAGSWQAAEPLSDTVLVGCSVAPGFDFDDFELMEAGSNEAKRLLALAPALSSFVDKQL